MTWTPIPSVFYTPQTVTVTIATPGVFTLNNHGLVAGDQVYLSTTGALPTGLSTGTQYFVISAGLTANNFELSATAGGSAINTSGTQSGVHSITAEATSSRFQAFLTTNLAALVPVGSYTYMHRSPGSSSLVNGCYLECNGQAVNRTTYASLFSLIGTTYGSGDGSTTFNLPDAAGRSLVGNAGTGGHTDVNGFNKSEGSAKANRTMRHQHTVAETAHSHGGSGASCSSVSGAHTHALGNFFDTQTSVGDAIPGGAIRTLDSITYTGNAFGLSTHTHSVSGLAGSSNSGGVTVTPGGSQPVDSPAYICAGTLYIKAL